MDTSESLFFCQGGDLGIVSSHCACMCCWLHQLQWVRLLGCSAFVRRAFSTLLSLDEPYSLMEGHLLVCLAKHIEANIVVSKSNNEGISDHLVTVGKLGAALAVDVILTHTRLNFEAGGESPCWFIPVLAHLLKVETGYHYVLLANSKRFYVAEESRFII